MRDDAADLEDGDWRNAGDLVAQNCRRLLRVSS